VKHSDDTHLVAGKLIENQIRRSDDKAKRALGMFVARTGFWHRGNAFERFSEPIDDAIRRA